jgi:peptidoglycan/LPS O-acetylase OafA/YrhL
MKAINAAHSGSNPQLGKYSVAGMLEATDNVGVPRVIDRFYALDGLRFLAVLLVAAFHYCFVAGRDGFSAVSIYPEVTQYMYLGVSLFFILSGFVIPYSGNNKSFKAFLILRGIRLYPAFWFCMLVTFISATLLFADPRFTATWRDVIFNTTMLPGFFGARMVDGVYWTLLVEIKFYVLFGLFLLVKRWVKFEWWLLAWMLVYAINQYIVPVPLSPLIAFHESPLFMIGILLYMMVSEGIGLTRLIALVAALYLAYGYELSQATANAKNFGSAFEMKYIFPVVLLFCLGVWLAAKISVPKWVRKLGDLTYPFYLLHDYLGLILISLFAIFLSPIGSITLVFILMMLFAYGVNLYVEVPAQKSVKNYFRMTHGRSIASQDGVSK